MKYPLWEYLLEWILDGAESIWGRILSVLVASCGGYAIAMIWIHVFASNPYDKDLPITLLLLPPFGLLTLLAIFLNPIVLVASIYYFYSERFRMDALFLVCLASGGAFVIAKGKSVPMVLFFLPILAIYAALKFLAHCRMKNLELPPLQTTDAFVEFTEEDNIPPE